MTTDDGSRALTISAGEHARLDARSADGTRGMGPVGVGGEIDRFAHYIDGVAEAVRATAVLRNVLAQVPKASSEMVAAAIRTIFAQPDAEHIRDQLEVVMLGR